MKRAILLAALLLFFVLFLAWKASAQDHGAGHAMHAMYDAATIESVQGTIAEIDSIASPMGHTGIHLKLQTAKTPLEVHLGPSWFLDRQEPHLQVGDAIVVTGSLVTINDQPALLARDVRRGEDTLVLRDADGRPVWRGWRRTGVKPIDG